MGTFYLHGLTLCVSEGLLFDLQCIHIVGIETFVHHGLILYVSEDFLPELFQIHIVDIDVFCA